MSDVPKQLKFSEDGRQKVLAIAKKFALESTGREDRYKAYLKARARIHRHTLANALDKGKACNFDTIDKICTVLGLNWEDVCEPIAQDETGDVPRPMSPNRTSPPVSQTDTLVNNIRAQVAPRIESECGFIRVRMSQNLPIDNLVEPNLYTIHDLPSEQFKSSSLLTGEVDEANFDRMGIIPQYDKPVDGKRLITSRRRLLVYASPGCGKTSYLKWLAIQCSRGEFLPKCVPIFISVRTFAPQALYKNLYSFIEEYLSGCGVSNVEQVSKTLFQESRIFLLLDGLDEVPGAMRETVDRHVAEVLNRSFNSHYAFTCRLALRLGFADGFQKTVIAPFNTKQRELYVKRWFQASTADASMERKFRDRLKLHVNFGELTRTPLLLDFLCRVFQDHDTFPNTRAQVYDWGLGSLLQEESRKIRLNSTLNQLSIEHTRALLQTIAADFFLRPHPQTLFERNEVERKIQEFFESYVSRNGSITNGSDTLSQLSFQQPPQPILDPPSQPIAPSPSPTVFQPPFQPIPRPPSPPIPRPPSPPIPRPPLNPTNGATHLPPANMGTSAPGMSSSLPTASKVIADIEVTYGLMIQQTSSYCSFSHLTFQEYFTAEYLVKTNQQARVYQHITDPQWRFVIELVAELLSTEQISGFFYGYQQALAQLMAANTKLQRFLKWVDSMAIALRNEVNTKRHHFQTLLRAWYFVFSLEDPIATQNIVHVSSKFEFPDFEYATSVIRSPTLELHRLFYQAYHATLAEPIPDTEPSGDRFDDLADGLTMMPLPSSRNYRFKETSGRYNANGFMRLVDAIYNAVQDDPALENHMAGWQQIMQRQLTNHSIPQDWWHHRRQFWHGKVASFMGSRYDLKCQWDFTPSEVKLLRTYYDATKLMSICMNRSRHLSADEHQTLSAHLLLYQPQQGS